MRTAAVLFLALALLLAALVPALSGPEAAVPVLADAMPVSADPSPAPEKPAWADMAYRHYDPTGFYASAEELTALAAGDDAEAVLALYDALYAELARIDTLSAIAYIRYCADVTDPYWSGERVYCSTLLSRTADALACAAQAVTRGPCAQAFAAHVGENAAAALSGHRPMTDREAELTVREAELVDEYNERMSDANAVTYLYNDRAWTQDMLSGTQGAALAAGDYDGYLEVWYGLQEALHAQVGPIFTELVAIRAELAEIEGYESYADMAYEQFYGRDYGSRQAQLLCDAVKPVGRTFTAALGDSPLWFAAGSVRPVLDGNTLLQALGQCAGRVDPALAALWQDMTDRGLCDIADGPDRFPGSFTVPLGAYDSAFLFAHFNGDCRDLGTLAHEFGHYAYNSMHPAQNLLTDTPCFDLLEVHSTGLEALVTEYYDELYTDNADTARFLALGDLLDALIEGCVFDEFQRQVYAQPDMTLDEIDRLFADICTAYGQRSLRDVDYTWIYVPHNFESPLYYLSYAASALAAIQIWDLARSDFEAGVAAWKSVLAADACREGYMTVLPACGLRTFTEPAAVAEICRPLLEELKRLADGA